MADAKDQKSAPWEEHKPCGCAKCKAKEVEQREAEAFAGGAMVALFGAAVIAASAGSDRLLRAFGKILSDEKPEPLKAKPLKAPAPKTARPRRARRRVR